MNKKMLLGIPLAALVLTLLIGGIYKAKASNDDFSQDGDTLIAYLGNSENVVIPDSVRKIGNEAFRGNTTLKSVTIPDSVQTIQYGAFAGCTALESVAIPDSVTTIEDSAFNGCTSLSDVTLGKCLYTLGSGVFADCDSLENVTVAPGNPSFYAADHALYNANKTVLYQYFAGSPETSYALPGTVSDVKRYSFWGCDNLKQLLLTGMTKLPDYAVANASGLEQVVISTPINEIGIGAFSGDTKLAQIQIPISVRSIHETAFEGCPDSMIFVCDPSSSAWRFAEEHEYATSETPVLAMPEIKEVKEAASSEEEGAATDTQSAEAQNGNADAGQAQQDAGDGNTATVTTAPEVGYTVSSESGSILLGGTQVVSDRAYVAVNMPVTGGNDNNADNGNGTAASGDYGSGDANASAPEIADYAHYLDQTLDRYDFSEDGAITRIGRFAFARTLIAQLMIPDGVTEIGEGAFYHCDRLFDVTIPSSVTTIGKNAFSYTPWYTNWLNDEKADDFLIVGDGVLIGYKGSETNPALPAGVKTVAEGVFGEE